MKMNRFAVVSILLIVILATLVNGQETTGRKKGGKGRGPLKDVQEWCTKPDDKDLFAKVKGVYDCIMVRI